MSNLSDIGFPVRSEQDVNTMIERLIEQELEPVRCLHGFYLKFVDASGAEIYLQGSRDQELVGFNPHFAGESRRTVGLTTKIERDSSELDGGFHAWAAPSGEGVEISGEYPFVFDVPDFRTVQIEDFPAVRDIQLTAFASNDFQMFASEEEFDSSQDAEVKYAAKSFVPTGLLAFDEADESLDLSVVRPIGMLSGEIKKFELKTNQLTNENFYWFLVETYGGEIDVVADSHLIPAEPKIGGIVRGQFWLSGRILAL